MSDAQLIPSFSEPRCNVLPGSIIGKIASRFVGDRDLPDFDGLTAAEVRKKLEQLDVRPVVQVDIPGKGVTAVYHRGKAERAAKAWRATPRPGKRRRKSNGTSSPSPSTLPSLQPDSLHLGLGALDPFPDAEGRAERP